MSDYQVPQHVINEWKKHCNCCEFCSPHPCDGVSVGSFCDDLECQCDEWDIDLED